MKIYFIKQELVFISFALIIGLGNGIQSGLVAGLVTFGLCVLFFQFVIVLMNFPIIKAWYNNKQL